MNDVYFAFGPENTYFFHGPKCCKSQGITDDFWDAVKKADGKITRVQCFAMNEKNEVFAIWQGDDKDDVWHWQSDSLDYQRLVEYYEEHEHDTRVAFGRDRDLVGWTAAPNKDLTWQCDDESWLWKRLDDGTPKLRLVALGVDRAAFVMEKNYKFQYSLAECYKTLYECIKDLNHGDIEFLALNAFRVEEFFMLLANNVAIFRVGYSYHEALADALTEHDITCIDLSPQKTLESTVAPVSETAKIEGD